MMKIGRKVIMKLRKALFFVLVLFLSVSPLFAQRRVTIRLASLVPENTAWGAAINRMAAEWEAITNGQVEVIVFHNGIAGSEAEVLRKMRINQLQAGVFTSIGLNSVVPEVLAVSYPFLIRNDAEMEYVMENIRPQLDAALQRQSFTTLAWVNAGWLKFFSKTPIYTPNDLRRVRVGSNPEEESMTTAFRAMGYNTVPVLLNDVLLSLNNNTVDTLYLSPVYAAGNQVFGIVRNMMDINLAPFMGGIIINEAVWRRIPERYRPQLMEVCRRLEAEIEASIINLEAEAISIMSRNGLVINELSSEQKQAWYDDIARFENNLVGGSNPVFNRELYFRINNLLTEYRRGH